MSGRELVNQEGAAVSHSDRFRKQGQATGANCDARINLLFLSFAGQLAALHEQPVRRPRATLVRLQHINRRDADEDSATKRLMAE